MSNKKTNLSRQSASVDERNNLPGNDLVEIEDENAVRLNVAEWTGRHARRAEQG